MEINIDERNKLVVEYYNFICKVARKFDPCSLPLDDLKQEGVFGFFNAIKTFKPEKGNFNSWAVAHITSAIKEAIRKNQQCFKNIDSESQLDETATRGLDSAVPSVLECPAYVAAREVNELRQKLPSILQQSSITSQGNVVKNNKLELFNVLFTKNEDGEYPTIAETARKLGVSPQTISQRVNKLYEEIRQIQKEDRDDL